MSTGIEHKEGWVLSKLSKQSLEQDCSQIFQHTPTITRPGNLWECCYPMKVFVHVRMSRIAEPDKYVMRGNAYSGIQMVL